MYYEKKKGLLLSPGKKWQEELYGFNPRGKGDVLFRTSLAAIAFKYQGVEMLSEVKKNLREGRRWPSWLDSERDARSRWDKYIADRRHEKKPGKYPRTKYRWVKGMTRDPYIMFWIACKLLGLDAWIKDTPLPKYLYRPQIVAFRRYLMYGEQKDLEKYRKMEMASLLISQFSGGLPVYAQHLAAWMAYMTDSTIIKADLLMICPAWNYLIHALCDGGPDEETVNNYRAKIGYQWTEKKKMEDDTWWSDDNYLDKNDPYKLDKAILNFVFFTRYKPN